MRNGLIEKEITVEPCICKSGKLNLNCSYITSIDIPNTDPYDNLANPEDMVE